MSTFDDADKFTVSLIDSSGYSWGDQFIELAVKLGEEERARVRFEFAGDEKLTATATVTLPRRVCVFDLVPCYDEFMLIAAVRKTLHENQGEDEELWEEMFAEGKEVPLSKPW